MYEAFYGLNGKPFNLTPDPRFLYLSQKHKEAFAHLVYGVQNRSGFVMITGEIGTGKTTICRSLLSQLDEDTELAFIFNPMLSPEEMLQKINEEFGIDTVADSVKGLIDELNEYLLDCTARGKNCVLIIDEAQNLDVSLLEQIRLLSNLETETQKLLQILLIGQPELIEKLSMPQLRQLNQRITARYHLKGLNLAETKEYIAFRLRVAGGLRKVRFTRGAVSIIYRVAKGTPRVINAICDRALLIGYTQESHQINSKIVRRAAREIQGEKVRAPRKKSAFRLTPRIAAAAALAVLTLFSLVYLFAPQGSLGSLVESAQRTITEMTPTAEPLGPLHVASAGPSNGILTPSVEPLEVKPTPPRATEVKPIPGAATTVATPAPEAEPDEAVDSASEPEAELALASAEAEPAPEPAIPSVSQRWPEALDPASAMANALGALLTAWDVDPDAPYPAEVTENAIARFASEHGLSSTYVRPTLDQLLTLNLPALVRVDSWTQHAWVALIGVEPESFTLSGVDGAFVAVDRELFARHYAKEAFILWRDPAPDLPVINPWTSGPAVEEFQSELVRLGFLSETGGVYDGEIIELVKRIQRAAGLTVDGIVGPQTRLLLAHWRPSSSMPMLAAEAFPEHIRDRVLGRMPAASGATETNSPGDAGDSDAASQPLASATTEDLTLSANNAPASAPSGAVTER